mmetsp:Transcript_20621/g.45152  ORF Transcript_20621/g.45152 Transcript_20621/m.45152 type:complete len:381 (-) Transcript_20621:161-1303(-)
MPMPFRQPQYVMEPIPPCPGDAVQRDEARELPVLEGAGGPGFCSLWCQPHTGLACSVIHEPHASSMRGQGWSLLQLVSRNVGGAAPGKAGGSDDDLLENGRLGCALERLLASDLDDDSPESRRDSEDEDAWLQPRPETEPQSSPSRQRHRQHLGHLDPEELEIDPYPDPDLESVDRAQLPLRQLLTLEADELEVPLENAARSLMRGRHGFAITSSLAMPPEGGPSIESAVSSWSTADSESASRCREHTPQQVRSLSRLPWQEPVRSFERSWRGTDVGPGLIAAAIECAAAVHIGGVSDTVSQNRRSLLAGEDPLVRTPRAAVLCARPDFCQKLTPLTPKSHGGVATNCIMPSAWKTGTTSRRSSLPTIAVGSAGLPRHLG